MLYYGKIKVTPKDPKFPPFTYPENGKAAYYCTKEVDGTLYYYTGKTPESAASSYAGDIVEVVCEFPLPSIRYLD